MSNISPLLDHLPRDRLAVSSWCWASDFYAGRFSLLDLPERAAAAGLHLVEANDFMLPPPRFSRLVQPLTRFVPKVNQELWRYRRQTLEQLKTALDRQGVRCLCWTINSDFSAELSGRLGRFLYRRLGLMAAEILEAKRLRINAGGHPQSENAAPLTAVVGRMTRFVEAALRRLPELAVVFENHWGMSSDIEIHVDLFRQVRARLSPAYQPRFALCLDPANIASADPRPLWELMAPLASHIHLKKRVERQEVDLPGLLELIDTAHQGSFDGFYVIEGEDLLSD